MFAMNPHVMNKICEEGRRELASKKYENIWTDTLEILFSYAMIGHKPVGVNRHFMMLLIHDTFTKFLKCEVSSKVLWDHLDSMYDMAALHESEIIPFPNEEMEFELPEDCIELLHTKNGVTLKTSSSENKTYKNNTNSSKASKKLTHKLKQVGTPINTAKSAFASSGITKPLKNTQSTVKSESKTSVSDAIPKAKKESGLSVKTNKLKRSSSPFPNKTVKSESVSITKEDSPDISSNKKSNKLERGNSPATLKKSVKTDPTITNNSSKKPSKSEYKPVKNETLENYVKKEKKVDKDIMSKKGKTSSSSEVSSKKLKVDTNSTKKRSDSESSSRKTSESSSVKQVKAEVKSSSHSSKGQEMEISPSSGSRKSSPVVKVKNSESSKKKLHSPRVEEPSKKITSAPKRRPRQ